VHFYLSSSGALLRFLLQEERPGLITGREQLATELQRWLRKKIDYYAVPNDYPIRTGNQSNSAVDLDAYVDVFERTARIIDVKYPGQLFLVGGGIWSKSICNRIKKLGGIALDIGAVCDAWLGIPSRPAVYKSMFDAATNAVPEGLLLSVQMEKAEGHG
jgi:hypothetical protein